MQKRYCSIPDIGNLRKWFEKNFNRACEMHDTLYARSDLTRFQADILLREYMLFMVKTKSIKSKLTVYYPTIALTFILVRCFGWTRYKR